MEQKHWALNLKTALDVTFAIYICVSLGDALHLYGFQFPYLKNRDDAHLTGCFEGLVITWMSMHFKNIHLKNGGHDMVSYTKFFAINFPDDFYSSSHGGKDR